LANRGLTHSASARDEKEHTICRQCVGPSRIRPSVSSTSHAESRSKT
jgi:hypothetical protein